MNVGKTVVALGVTVDPVYLRRDRLVGTGIRSIFWTRFTGDRTAGLFSGRPCYFGGGYYCEFRGFSILC